jgi:Ser/Thr protein kinase RdoA (MazF antagonist)
MWQLTTDRADWAVKELFTGVTAEDPTEATARRDTDFQLAAHAAGVSMPLPRLRGDGSVLTTLPSTDGTTVLVRVYSWVDLAPGPEPASPVQAARQLGRLHSVPWPDDSPADPWFWEPFDDERWPDLVEVARAAGAPWAERLAARVPALLADNAIVRSGGYVPDVRCHLDLNPQNVLRLVDGAAVVVDWENSGPATVDQELASVIAEFVPDAGDLPPFLDAYLSAGGPAVRLTEASFTMTLAVQAHLLAWYAQRALDPEVSEEDRARAAFWAADMCDLLFTVKQVQAWLAAAAPLLG